MVRGSMCACLPKEEKWHDWLESGDLPTSMGQHNTAHYTWIIHDSNSHTEAVDKEDKEDKEITLLPR